MVSKNQKKLIKSLSLKKFRKQEGLFVAEGDKLVKELIALNLQLHSIFTLNPHYFKLPSQLLFECTKAEMQSISLLKNSQNSLAIFKIPSGSPIDTTGLIVGLDNIQDPGNLGTIIRLCDWFGVKHMVCSQDTVDAYNPKVVQATMGSIGRVHIHYTNLEKFLKELPNEHAIFGAFMNGKNVYGERLLPKAVLILGNEGSGISEKVGELITHRISIPKFNHENSIESLNVATAGAILLNEFRRM